MAWWRVCKHRQIVPRLSRRDSDDFALDPVMRSSFSSVIFAVSKQEPSSVWALALPGRREVHFLHHRLAEHAALFLTVFAAGLIEV
jgi:hypothetical protein